MATVRIPHFFSQSTADRRSPVKVEYLRTVSASRPGGTAIKIVVGWISTPAASGFNTGAELPGLLCLLLLRFLLYFSSCMSFPFDSRRLVRASKRVQSPRTGLPFDEGVTNVLAEASGPMLQVGLFTEAPLGYRDTYQYLLSEGYPKANLCRNLAKFPSCWEHRRWA